MSVEAKYLTWSKQVGRGYGYGSDGMDEAYNAKERLRFFTLTNPDTNPNPLIMLREVYSQNDSMRLSSFKI